MEEHTTNGVKIEKHVVGDGAQPAIGQTLVVDYTGKLEDGTVFDSSTMPGRNPFEFQVGTGQVIQGWDEGFMSLTEGTKATLTIPSNMAYGPNGQGPIPPNATLIFDVELIEVK